MELKRNLSLAAYLSARKTYLQKKGRNLQARRVCRKRRSVCVISGTHRPMVEKYDRRNYVPDWCWRKNVRMSKECFISFIPLKSLLLCSGSHLVSWKTKSLRMSKLTFQPRLKFRFDYMRFFQIFRSSWKTGLGFLAWAELRPGLNPSPCNRQFDFKRICFRSRNEISAWLAGLKFAM